MFCLFLQIRVWFHNLKRKTNRIIDAWKRSFEISQIKKILDYCSSFRPISSNLIDFNASNLNYANDNQITITQRVPIQGDAFEV